MSFQDIGRPRRVPFHEQAHQKRTVKKRSIHQAPCSEFSVEPSNEFRTPERRQSCTSRVVTPPAGFVSRTKSRISDEVVHFQKLVVKIESTLKRRDQSPEDHWRSRIMVRSAKEADVEICQKLQDYFTDMNYSPSMPDQKTKLLHEKLTRDYCRAHDSFQSLLIRYNIGTDDDEDIPAPVEWLSPAEIQQKMIAQQEEDFFVRAMRERETEVRGINKSMHQVKEIYKELGRVVESQQEKINSIEANVMHSRANAQCGLKEVEQANSPSCLEIALDSKDESQLDYDFRWTMPFETIGEDLKSVQNDIASLGKDICAAASTKMSLARRPVLRCASIEDVSNSTFYG